MKKGLDHALHNQEICGYLQTKENAQDWVITTAFYSALHFVEYFIFPLKSRTGAGQKFIISNIDEYCNIHHAGPHPPNKHKIRMDLVSVHCTEIESNYKWLKDTCWTARYRNYKFENPLYIQKTIENLDKIKTFCEKKGAAVK